MIYVQGGGKQTHYVLSTANSSAINIGGLPADTTSVNDTFAATDVGDIIRVIVRNVSTLQDYETTIVAVNSGCNGARDLANSFTTTFVYMKYNFATSWGHALQFLVFLAHHQRQNE
jgi:hypothetical protein